MAESPPLPPLPPLPALPPFEARLDHFAAPLDGSSLGLSTAWPSVVESAWSTAEVRRLVSGRPVRSLSHRFGTFGVEEAWLGQAWLAGLSGQRPLAGLWSDVAVVLEAAGEGGAAGATRLVCDTRWRRFFAGHRAAVYRVAPDGRPGAFEAVVVVSVDGDGLEVLADPAVSMGLPAGPGGGLSRSYPAGSRVLPLVECDPVLSAGGEHVHGSLGVWGAELREAGGETQLPALAEPGTLPAGFEVYDGLPVLAGVGVGRVQGVGASAGWERSGELVDLGLTRVPSLRGGRSARTFGLRAACFGREAAWRLLRFFDSRGGGVWPFWVVSPVRDLMFVSASGSSVTLSFQGGRALDDADRGLDGWAGRSHVALTLTDGTTLIRPVASVEQVDRDEVLTLGEALPGGLTASAVRGVSTAVRARFAGDTLEEGWVHSGLMTAGLEAVELTSEVDVGLSNVVRKLTVGLTAAAAVAGCVEVGEPGPLPPGATWRVTSCATGAVQVIAHDVQDLSGLEGSVRKVVGGNCSAVSRGADGAAVTTATPFSFEGDTFSDCVACTSVYPPGDDGPGGPGGPGDPGDPGDPPGDDGPAPCDCPPGLADSYTVTFTLDTSCTSDINAGVYSGTATLNRVDPVGRPCYWVGSSPGHATGDINLEIQQGSKDGVCEWTASAYDFPGATGSKKTGSTPSGGYEPDNPNPGCATPTSTLSSFSAS